MKLAKPESQGFDGARLARIDAFLKERYLDSGKLPHAQLLVARDGEIVHFSQPGPGPRGRRAGRREHALPHRHR